METKDFSIKSVFDFADQTNAMGINKCAICRKLYDLANSFKPESETEVSAATLTSIITYSTCMFRRLGVNDFRDFVSEKGEEIIIAIFDGKYITPCGEILKQEDLAIAS